MSGSSTVIRLLLVCVTAILLLGCKTGDRTASGGRSSGPPAPAVTMAPASTATAPGAVPGDAAGDSRSSPQATGTVAGQFLAAETRAPLADLEVFLARLEGTSEFPIAALDRSKDPHAVTRPDGTFQFDNVWQGRYVLVAGTEESGGMVRDAFGGRTLIVEVADGQATDVGSIVIQEP